MSISWDGRHPTLENYASSFCALVNVSKVPRFMTRTCLLDYDSIAGADKFGNIFVLRVPADVSDDIDNPTGDSNVYLQIGGYLMITKHDPRIRYLW